MTDPPGTLRFVSANGPTWIIPTWAIHLGDEPTECRSCRAPILWAESRSTGKRAPLDPDGTSHFATCPQAATWRKPR